MTSVGKAHDTPAMTVHMLKLSVGSDGIQDLADWQKHVRARSKVATGKAITFHRTRMFPKLEAELTQGGSLYWVIKRLIQVRQEIIGLERVTGSDGIKRCDIILSPKLIPVRPTPRRPFQGWRYLQPEDAPPDMTESERELSKISPEMRNELSNLGLL